MRTIVLAHKEDQRPLLDSSIFFGGPLIDSNERNIGASVLFLKVVFIFAVRSIIGSSSMLPGGLGAAEANLAEMLRAGAGRTSGPATAGTLIVGLVTSWFAMFVGTSRLVAVRRFVPASERVYRRNV